MKEQNGKARKVELLAPAGSRDALTGAVCAGADAVYLGGEQFGARAYAENFSTQEILRAIREAHLLGRKIYLTANILTREEELGELVRFVGILYEGGLDGAIVQDLGVLSALREACPDLPLHASTQMSVTSAEAVRFLRRLGVSRVVPARELTLEELRMLRQEDPAIEIEAFIHGAMCYSYSGRCLMSSFLGGRSGNRGRCAGTCRLPFRILDENRKAAGPDAGKKEVWPLSMKDMCVLPILPELIDAGIDSFKIEGRMKKPVYAAGVTGVYRKYIDRFREWDAAGRPGEWQVEEADLDLLRSLYIRTELGTGYYHAYNGRGLVTIGKPGYAGTDPELEERIRQDFLGGMPQIPVEGRAAFRIGEPARLQLRAAGEPQTVESGSACPETGEPVPGDSGWIEVTGASVQRAAARPLPEEELRSRLSRTGDSLFVFSDLEIEADEGIFLPVSAVNGLRREALRALEDALCAGSARSCGGDTAAQESVRTSGQEKEEDPELPSSAHPFRTSERPRELWALVSTEAQREAAVRAGCSCILIDGDFLPSADGAFSDDRTGSEKNTENETDFKKKTQKGNNCTVQSHRMRWIRALPPVFRTRFRDRIRGMILRAEKEGFSGILVRTLEELELAKEAGYRGEIIADASLYSWNSRSMKILLRDCARIVCPLELSGKDIRKAALAAAGESSGSGNLTETAPLILPVYGRVPMMETAGCVRKTEKACTGREGFWYLADRKGKQMPVRCRCGICSNTIYNAVPLSLHSCGDEELFKRTPVLLCMFTDESGGRTGSILRYFEGLAGETDKGKDSFTGRKQSGKPGRKTGSDAGRGSGGTRGRGGSGESRKNNTAMPPFSEYTTGHYRSGAL